MTAVYYTLGVVIFFVAILTSIGLHELGHMIPAKKFGGKVTQYFIGFGPTVWSKRVGETEYGVKAIPLGGYVKIVGMLPPGADQLADEHTTDADGNDVVRVRKSNTGMFTQLISDARAAEWETIRPEDSDRLFYKMPWWKKVVVMSGGPSVNILIAFGLFLRRLRAVRQPQRPAGSAPWSPPSRPAWSRPRRTAGSAVRTTRSPRPGRPASRPATGSWPSTAPGSGTGPSSSGLIRGNENGRAAITVRRDGRELTLTTNTLVTARPTSASDERLVQVGFLGVAPTYENVTGGPWYTLEQMGTMTKDSVAAMATLPVKVWHVGRAIFGLEQRALDSPVSIVGGGRLAGETVSHQGFPLVDKTVFLLMLIAGFNLFIGLFNFVPLLPLDGGHIAGALWEARAPRRRPPARAARTRGTSTWRGCCRSRTRWRWCCW